MDPRILTPDVYPQFLSEEALDASRLELRLRKAEMYVVSRYTAERQTALTFRFAASEGDVLLDGWAENADGEPQPGQMPDDLVERLRIVIADVVEHWIRDDEREDIARLVEGDKQVFYDTDQEALPSRLFRPLDKHDQREGVTGFW